MSTIVVTSTTEPKEAAAAKGDLAKNESDADEQSASAKGQDETQEESETSEATEGDENRTDGDSDDESEGEASEPEKKPKKVGGYQRKVNKLTKRVSVAEQERDFWKSEAMKRQGAEKPNEPVSAKPVVEDSRPKAEDFDGTHEEYLEALTDWKVDQRLAKAKQKDQEKALRDEMAGKKKTLAQKIESFSAEHEDWDELMEGVEDIRMPLAVEHALLDSEDAPTLMYALAQDREEYERICSLPAQAAARAIGRFEAKLLKSDSDPIVDKKLKTKKTPAPIEPVGSRTSGSKKSIFDKDLTQSEYEELRREQQARRA